MYKSTDPAKPDARRARQTGRTPNLIHLRSRPRLRLRDRRRPRRSRSGGVPHDRRRAEVGARPLRRRETVFSGLSMDARTRATFSRAPGRLNASGAGSAEGLASASTNHRRGSHDTAGPCPSERESKGGVTRRPLADRVPWRRPLESRLRADQTKDQRSLAFGRRRRSWRGQLAARVIGRAATIPTASRLERRRSLRVQQLLLAVHRCALIEERFWGETPDIWLGSPGCRSLRA